MATGVPSMVMEKRRGRASKDILSDNVAVEWIVMIDCSGMKWFSSVVGLCHPIYTSLRSLCSCQGRHDHDRL
jgi:hypothetical protein